MRRLTTLMLVLGVVAVASLALQVSAQGGPSAPTTQPGPRGGPGGPDGPGGRPPGPPPFHILPRQLVEKLNLTEDQMKQVAELEKETKAKLEKILTDEQRKTLSEFRPPRRPNGQGGPNRPGGPNGQQGGPPHGPPPQES